jgi:hypothetical protein
LGTLIVEQDIKMNPSRKHRAAHLIMVAALTLVALACTCGSLSGLNPAATALDVVTSEAPPNAPIYDGGDGYQTSATHMLEIGETNHETLDTLSEAHNWLFTGQEGQTVTILVSGQGVSDPRARLLDPQGNVIAEDDDSGEGLDAFISRTLTESGLYTIRVDVFQEGPYTISLDAFEAADSGGEAGTLSYGETVSGQITSEDEADFWRFDGRQGDFVTITIQASGNLNGVVRLLDPTGAPLASSEGQNAQVEYLLQSDGLHTIIVSHTDQSSGTYRLTLGQGEIETLSYGGSAQGQISASHTQDYYTFMGAEGDAVIITMVSTGGDLDSFLHLQGPDGLELAYDDDGGGYLDAQISRFVLPEQGTYTIIATRYGGREGDSSGGYQLTLELVEPLDLTPVGELEYGVEVYGTITVSDYEDRWTFEGEQGETISLIMEATSGSILDSYLRLLDAQGAELASSDDYGYSSNSRIEGFDLPSGGTYTVVATRFGAIQGETYGGYALLLMQGIPEPPPPDGELRYGDTVEGEIDDQNYQDRWVFQGAEGDLATIRMERVDGELDSILILLGPDDTEVYYDDDSGGDLNALIRGFMLPEDGSYTIVASRLGERSGTSAGGYTLALVEEEPEDTTPNGSLQYGGSVSGEITDENYSDYWTFQGSAGDLVAIAMQADADASLDSYLRLLGPDGEEIAADDDSGGNLNSLVVAALPETGTYTIGAQRLGGLNGYGYGAYTVTLDRATDVETLSIDQPVTGEITDAAPYTIWAFDGQAGSAVTITMEALDEMLDPYLTLLGPDGMVLATDDDGGGLLNARIYQVLAQSGTYRVIASRFGGVGEYELAVRSGQFQEQQADLPVGEGGGSIQYGETITGQISGTREAERWTFEGSEGDLIAISMEGDSGSLDTFLVLLEPGGNEIGFNDDGGQRFNSVLYAQLPEDGTYTIVASRYDGSGSYTLTLEQKEGTPVAFDASRTGQIGDDNPFDFWTFDGEEGMVVTISLEPTTRQLEPALLLLGPDGQEIAYGADQGATAEIAAFELPDDGPYAVVASRDGGVQGDSEGGYRLRLEAD